MLKRARGVCVDERYRLVLEASGLDLTPPVSSAVTRVTRTALCTRYNTCWRLVYTGLARSCAGVRWALPCLGTNQILWGGGGLGFAASCVGVGVSVCVGVGAQTDEFGHAYGKAFVPKGGLVCPRLLGFYAYMRVGWDIAMNCVFESELHNGPPFVFGIAVCMAEESMYFVARQVCAVLDWGMSCAYALTLITNLWGRTKEVHEGASG